MTDKENDHNGDDRRRQGRPYRGSLVRQRSTKSSRDEIFHVTARAEVEERENTGE